MVAVEYNNLLISFQYREGSSIGEPSSRDNLTVVFIKRDKDLLFFKPVSISISWMNLCGCI